MCSILLIPHVSHQGARPSLPVTGTLTIADGRDVTSQMRTSEFPEKIES